MALINSFGDMSLSGTKQIGEGMTPEETIDVALSILVSTLQQRIEDGIDAAVNLERERCARIAEGWPKDNTGEEWPDEWFRAERFASRQIAATIREGK